MADAADLRSLTADIVASHVSNNRISPGEIGPLISSVYKALSGLGVAAPETEDEAPQPAVSIRASIKPDYIVCLEDGKKLTMLKRYLRARYDMSPDDYRKKWGLPADYPMVSPSYADRRRVLAKEIGLGRKPKAKS